MKKKLALLFMAVCLTVGNLGCSIGTTGEASWEAYVGVRSKQISDAPAKVEIESTVVDKVVDFVTKKNKTSAE